jgi:hypothetical protein
MKNQIDTSAPSRTQEDTAFLSKIQNGRLSVNDVLMAAPPRFLSHTIEEVQFPKRFATKVAELNVRTLSDMFRIKFDELAGKNLGSRTLEVAAESLAEFLKRKIAQKEMVTLRDQMRGFCDEILAREARIFEFRFGLNGQRLTLEAVGEKFNLTRERVRQIEAALFSLFSKRYPAVKEIAENAKDGMKLSELALHTHPLIDVSDPLPIAALLENLEPKLYLVGGEGIEYVISSAPRTGFEATLKKSENIAEDIFRSSEVSLTKETLAHEMKKRGVDSTTMDLIINKVSIDGIWVDAIMLSPDKDKTNVAIGRLQMSDKPLHLEALADEIGELTGEDTTPENLRSSLSLVPSVRSFGYGMVGFKRHVFIKQAQAEKVIKFCEGMVARGPDGYQWMTKDFTPKIRAKFPDVDLGHHELSVILRDSSKLQYLGRLTFIQKGEGEERKLYRDIITGILKKSGKAMAEDKLVEAVRKQRGFHPNVHMRNEVEVCEVLPHVWGLTRRDHPFNKKELAALERAFDATFHNGKEFNDAYLAEKKIETHGMKAVEIMKVIEVMTEAQK